MAIPVALFARAAALGIARYVVKKWGVKRAIREVSKRESKNKEAASKTRVSKTTRKSTGKQNEDTTGHGARGKSKRVMTVKTKSGPQGNKMRVQSGLGIKGKFRK